MSSPDWVRIEAALSLLLPRSGTVSGNASARPRLLATLADYSKAAVHEARRLGAIVPSDAESTKALEWLLRPVFICGQHRSGTTLLQSLLDGHPQLLSLPAEGTYFSSFAYVSRPAPTDTDLNRFAADWISRFVDPNFEPHFRLGTSGTERSPAVDFARHLFGWYAALCSRVAREFAALLALAAAYRLTAAPAAEPEAWVEKTPQNERYASRFGFFEAARFIQLVRDPRDSLASLGAIYRNAALGPFDAGAGARAIGRSLRLARENSRRLGSDRYLVVRYEDLVAEPARQMERVRQYLRIADAPSLLVPSAGAVPVAANSSFDAHAAGSIERSRSRPLPEQQLMLLRAYAADEARPFGYDIGALAAAHKYAIRMRASARHTPRFAWTCLRRAFRHR